eukprot:6466972-Prymnesium_polylepis.1
MRNSSTRIASPESLYVMWTVFLREEDDVRAKPDPSSSPEGLPTELRLLELRMPRDELETEEPLASPTDGERIQIALNEACSAGEDTTKVQLSHGPAGNRQDALWYSCLGPLAVRCTKAENRGGKARRQVWLVEVKQSNQLTLHASSSVQSTPTSEFKSGYKMRG